MPDQYLKHINLVYRTLIQNWKILLLVIFLEIPAVHISAQGWKQEISQDSISISYKWQKEKILKKHSPYVLLLKVKNNRKNKVTISFVVIYYWKAQIHSTSETKRYCIKSGQTIKGKKWNLAFESDFIVMNKYLDPMFSWKIGRLKVEENKNCNNGLKLRLQQIFH